MRTALFTALAAALVGSGAFALAASGGQRSGPPRVDIRAATARTAAAPSVHYAFTVRLDKARQPRVLHVAGASSRAVVSVRLRLDDLKLPDGESLPGTTGAIMLSRPFLYEEAPGGVAGFGIVRWLRLHLAGLSPRSQTLSSVRSLTPSPLLRILSEATLRPSPVPGTFAGTASYDDPVVRTALHALGGGLEFRNLQLSVAVGRDGLIHSVRITGRTADGSTGFSLHARLYAYGAPVNVVPPKPGTFVDQDLAQLSA